MQKPNTPLTLNNLAGLTVLVGINYVDKETNELLAQRVYGGAVTSADQEAVSINIGKNVKESFNIPSDLSAWFLAPEGQYPLPGSDQVITNPNYLIAWNVYRVKPKTHEDGQHEWWEWVPSQEAPQVKPNISH